MTDPIALVDEFIEDLVRGNIESYIMDFTKFAYERNFDDGPYQERLKSLYDLIEDYQSSTEKEKFGNAMKVQGVIMKCRFTALLKNNPNSIKAVIAERDFFKSRANAAEERVKYLEDQLKAAYTAFDNMMKRFESAGPPKSGGQSG